LDREVITASRLRAGKPRHYIVDIFDSAMEVRDLFLASTYNGANLWKTRGHESISHSKAIVKHERSERLDYITVLFEPG
jgi:hypothetical protein